MFVLPISMRPERAAVGRAVFLRVPHQRDVGQSGNNIHQISCVREEPDPFSTTNIIPLRLSSLINFLISS